MNKGSIKFKASKLILSQSFLFFGLVIGISELSMSADSTTICEASKEAIKRVSEQIPKVHGIFKDYYNIDEKYRDDIIYRTLMHFDFDEKLTSTQLIFISS